ncbi:hypothetical protein BGW38_003147 [Lunasporangiospora selenospora]|uniref:C2 domain-containing protein n=1 Tax=Lunasporangiospora selenospora TaxID=979761 RepID=A0A9P6KD19_9FUNG|nr:hypothetical protein BGW38_003147 [Lunasporangiospora selenospora]
MSGLARGDILTSDPYLEATLVDAEDKKTKLTFITGVVWKTLNPTWEAEWNLLGVPDGYKVIMEVKDKDRMKADTELGIATLELNGPKLDGTQKHDVDVMLSATRKYGTVQVSTTAHHSRGSSARLQAPTTSGPVRYSRHTSYAAGMLTREEKFEFYAYRMRLNHLMEIFGEDPQQYQHWNRGYDAAQRIFADSLEGLQIRNALHSQHSYLYRHGKTTAYNDLRTAKDLGTLLHGERLKANPEQDLKMTVFTYSIVPKGMYFSETGTAFFQDFMSKHAMHANRSQEVLFSGEFRLIQNPHHLDNWTLLIDNNSGTYSPRKDDLHKVKELFVRNFPDLDVEVYDHEDSYLKDIRKATKEMEQQIVSQQKQKMSLFSSSSFKAEASKEESEL